LETIVGTSVENMKFCGQLKKSAGFLLKTQVQTMVLLESSEMLKFFALPQSHHMSVLDLKIPVLFLWQFYCFLASEQLHFPAVVTSVAAFGGEIVKGK